MIALAASGRFLPAHVAALVRELDVIVTLVCRRRRVGGLAVIGTVRCHQRDDAICFPKPGPNLGRIVGAIPGQHVGGNLTCAGVHGPMELAPVPACTAVPFCVPLALPEQTQARAVQREADHSCLSYWRNARHGRWVLLGEDRRVTLRVASRYRTNHPEAVADAAAAGLGIALLPLVFITCELADGRLVRMLKAWSAETEFGETVSAVALPDRLRLGRDQALLQFLKTRLGPPCPRP